MSSNNIFKLNCQPYIPTCKSRHVQRKMASVTMIYSSQYLRLLKEYNTEMPTDCQKEHLEYIVETQQSTSLQPKKVIDLNKMDNLQKQSQWKYTKSKGMKHHETSKNPSISFQSNQLNQLKKQDQQEIEMKENTHEKKKTTSREKQILFGKSTREYQNYIRVIPKEKRLISDPVTPDIEQSMSKRTWDGVVRRWRRSLHAYDTVTEENQIDLARALAFRLQDEDNPKKSMMTFTSTPYTSYLIHE